MSKIDPKLFRELGFLLAGDEANKLVPTFEQQRMVVCPICRANEGLPCQPIKGIYHTMSYNHAERVELATHKLNILQNTDKTIIIQYAFLIMAEMVSAKSKELMGKEVTAKQVQQHFAQIAINELVDLGAIKK